MSKLAPEPYEFNQLAQDAITDETIHATIISALVQVEGMDEERAQNVLVAILNGDVPFVAICK